jgi:hypothetical protein
VFQGGKHPVGEQDENNDRGQRDEVRIATPAIISLIVPRRPWIHAIRLDWVAENIMGVSTIRGRTCSSAILRTLECEGSPSRGAENAPGLKAADVECANGEQPWRVQELEDWRMKYEYHFYKGSPEGSVSTISTDAPLPHIEVGNTLLLELPDLSTTAGYYWEIREVESFLFAPSDGQLRRIVIHVSVRERARRPEQ